MLTMRLLFLDILGFPQKRPRPSRTVYELPIQPTITTVSAQDAGQRQLCVSYICRQRSCRSPSKPHGRPDTCTQGTPAPQSAGGVHRARVRRMR